MYTLISATSGVAAGLFQTKEHAKAFAEKALPMLTLVPVEILLANLGDELIDKGLLSWDGVSPIELNTVRIH